MEPFTRRPYETVLSFDGMQMRAQEAEELGLIRRLPSGLYAEAGDPTGKAPEAIQRAPSESERDDGDLTHTVNDLNRLYDSVGDEIAQDGLISVIDGGEVAPHVIQAIVAQNGITEAQAKARVASVEDGYRRHAEKVFAESGITDLEAFYAWCWKHEPTHVKDAMTRHVTQGATDGYSRLTRLYRSNNR